MKKIDLTPYKLGEAEVDVKGLIVTVMFDAGLKLSARDLIAQDALAKKIEESNGSVLLEVSEYLKVKNAVEKYPGFGRGALPIINRVFDAPEASVKEV